MSPDRQPQHRYPDDELFGSLFDQEATGIAVTTLAGRFLRVNRALCAMIGYSAGELLEKTFRDITHPEDVESSESFRQRLISGDVANQTLDKRYIRKDGKVIGVRIVVTVVRDGSGSPQCCATLVHDMTANMQAQEASRESEHRFRRMVEMSTDWFWEQDAQMRFVRVPGFEKSNFDPASAMAKLIRANIRAFWNFPIWGRCRRRCGSGTGRCWNGASRFTTLCFCESTNPGRCAI